MMWVFFACFLFQVLCIKIPTIPEIVPLMELSVVKERNVNDKNREREILQSHFSLTFRMEAMIKNAMDGKSIHESIKNTGKESFMHILDSNEDLNYHIYRCEDVFDYTFESVVTVEAKDMHNHIMDDQWNFPNTVYFIFKPKVRECISSESIERYYSDNGINNNFTDEIVINGEKFQRCTEFYNLKYVYMNFSFSEVTDENITKMIFQKCEKCSNCITTEWGSFFFSLENTGDIYVLNDRIFFVTGILVALFGSVFGFFALCIVNPILLKCIFVFLSKHQSKKMCRCFSCFIDPEYKDFIHSCDPRRKNPNSALTPGSCCLLSLFIYLFNLYNGIICSGCGILLGCIYETTLWNYSSLIFLYSDWFSFLGFEHPFFMTGNFFQLERIWIQSVSSVVTSIAISTSLFFVCVIGVILQYLNFGILKLLITTKYKKAKKINREIDKNSIELEEIEEKYHESPKKIRNKITQKLLQDSENYVRNGKEKLHFSVLEYNEYFEGKRELFFDKKETVIATNGKTLSTIKMCTRQENDMLMDNKIVEFKGIINNEIPKYMAELIFFASLAGGTFKKGEYSILYLKMINILRKDRLIPNGIKYIKGEYNAKLVTLEKKRSYSFASWYLLFFSDSVVEKILERKNDIIRFKTQVKSNRYGIHWDLMDMELCRISFKILTDFNKKMNLLVKKSNSRIPRKQFALLKIRNIVTISNYLNDIKNLRKINNSCKICTKRVFNSTKKENGVLEPNPSINTIFDIFDKKFEMIKKKFEEFLKPLEIDKPYFGLKLQRAEIIELCSNKVCEEILKSSKDSFSFSKCKILLISIDFEKKKEVSELKKKCLDILKGFDENKEKINILSKFLLEFSPIFLEYYKLFAKIKIVCDIKKIEKKYNKKIVNPRLVFESIKRTLEKYHNLQATIIFILNTFELIEKRNEFHVLRTKLKNEIVCSQEKRNIYIKELPILINEFVEKINHLKKKKEKRNDFNKICNGYQYEMHCFSLMIQSQLDNYNSENVFEKMKNKINELKEKYEKDFQFYKTFLESSEKGNNIRFDCKTWVCAFDNHIDKNIKFLRKILLSKKISAIEFIETLKIIGVINNRFQELDKNVVILNQKIKDMRKIFQNFILFLWDQKILNSNIEIEPFFKDLKKKGEKIYLEMLELFDTIRNIKRDAKKNEITKRILFFSIDFFSSFRKMLYSFFLEIDKWMKFYSSFYFESKLKSRDYYIKDFFIGVRGVNYLDIDYHKNKYSEVFIRINNRKYKKKIKFLFSKEFDKKIKEYFIIADQIKKFDVKDLDELENKHKLHEKTYNDNFRGLDELLMQFPLCLEDKIKKVEKLLLGLKFLELEKDNIKKLFKELSPSLKNGDLMKKLSLIIPFWEKINKLKKVHAETTKTIKKQLDNINALKSLREKQKEKEKIEEIFSKTKGELMKITKKRNEFLLSFKYQDLKFLSHFPHLCITRINRLRENLIQKKILKDNIFKKDFEMSDISNKWCRAKTFIVEQKENDIEINDDFIDLETKMIMKLYNFNDIEIAEDEINKMTNCEKLKIQGISKIRFVCIFINEKDIQKTEIAIFLDKYYRTDLFFWLRKMHRTNINNNSEYNEILLNSKVCQSESDIRNFMRKILDCISYVHSKNGLNTHFGSIEPRNILMNSIDDFCIMGFGETSKINRYLCEIKEEKLYDLFQFGILVKESMVSVPGRFFDLTLKEIEENSEVSAVEIEILDKLIGIKNGDDFNEIETEVRNMTFFCIEEDGITKKDGMVNIEKIQFFRKSSNEFIKFNKTIEFEVYLIGLRTIRNKYINLIEKCEKNELGSTEEDKEELIKVENEYEIACTNFLEKVSKFYKEKIKTSNDLFRSRIKVIFLNEGGIDAGGLLRELYSEVSICLEHSKFVDKCGNFYLPTDKEDCSIFFFNFGKMLCRRVCEGEVINNRFGPLLYFLLIEKELKSFKDWEFFCRMYYPEEYKNKIIWGMKKPIKEFESYVERVTNNSKRDHFKKSMKAFLLGGNFRSANIGALKKGFFSFLPKELNELLIKACNGYEFQRIVSGKSFFTKNDVKNLIRKGSVSKTVYEGLLDVIDKDFDEKDLVLFVRYCTGNNFLKCDGTDQKIGLLRSAKKKKIFAHTCSFTVEIGNGFDSYESRGDFSLALRNFIRQNVTMEE